MIDSIKTVSAGFGGVGIWWVDGLSVVVQLCISLATLVYIIVKIRKELK